MLISGCVIARDESANIARCVASLAGFADEVVVYDTGSLDDTAACARSAGAVVVEGSWPGGFAAARNAALAHCGGEWVLSIDADEELSCTDRAGVRVDLAGAPPELVALQVSIDNATGTGLASGYASVAERLFRRTRCRWQGRLHEQLVDVATGTLVASSYLASARIAHHGYLHAAVATGGKLERNLALARAEVDEPSFGDRGIALVMLGRALWAADRPEEALAALLDGAAATVNPTARRQGLGAAVRILLRLGRSAEAAPLVAQLRAASRRPVTADVLEAGVHLASGRFAAALALLETVSETVRDDDGYEHAPHTLAEWRAAALLGLDRPGEAATLLLDVLHDRGTLDADLDLVVEACERDGRGLDVLAAALFPEGASEQRARTDAVVAATLRLDPDRAHRLLDALWAQVDGALRAQADEVRGAGLTGAGLSVLAAAALLGRVLPVDDAVTWSARLRDHGLAELCPLVALAGDRSAPPARRADAAAAVLAHFADGRGQLRPESSALHAPESVVRRSASVAAPLAVPATERLLGFSIVLVASGGPHAVQESLLHLAASLPGAGECEVVVVDPGTTDGTAAVLDGLAGDVVVVRSTVEISHGEISHGETGHGAARNAGAAEARGAVLVFLDTAVRGEPGWLAALLAPFAEAARRSSALGALAPVLRAGTACAAGFAVRFGSLAPPPAAGLAHRPWSHHDEPLVPVVEPMPAPDDEGAALASGGAGRADPVPADTVPVAAVPASAMAVRRAAFTAVGGFDEAYPGGGSEVDLCFALRRAGWSVRCATRVEMSLGRGGASPDGADGAPPWSSAGFPFAPTDPGYLTFEEGVGVRWQLTDGRERFTSRWAGVLEDSEAG